MVSSRTSNMRDSTSGDNNASNNNNNRNNDETGNDIIVFNRNVSNFENNNSGKVCIIAVILRG